MSKVGTTQVQSRLANLRTALDFLTSRAVYVGVPREKATRSGPGRINNAALAYIHDNGAPEVNIPARPFMKPGVMAVKTEIVERQRIIAEAAFAGRVDAVDKGLHALGLVVSASIKREISKGIPPPLRPSTIAKRRARGRTGTIPLIDTGALRNSITYVIREE